MIERYHDKMNYSVKDFWNFWCNGSDQSVMEIRFRDYKVTKAVATELQLAYSFAGVYIDNYESLLKIIKRYRDHFEMWCSVNPKKQIYLNPTDKHRSFTGKDLGLYSIKNILVDIDRHNKKGQASKKELDKINEFSDILIDFFKENGVDRHMKICSGNGVQILIPLDEEIVMPMPACADNAWVQDDRFLKYKNLTKLVFGNVLRDKFNPKAKQYYGCDIDRCFNIGRVMALPYTYNLKYAKQLRYILGSSEGKNEGLADSLFDQLENLQLPKYNRRLKKQLGPEFKFKVKNIQGSSLVRFILNIDLLANTGINNKLIFQFKCLCIDNGIDLNDPYVLKIRALFNIKFKRSFAWNTPDKKFHFDPSIVNSYCVDNWHPLLYEPFIDRPKLREFNEHEMSWDNYTYALKKPVEIDSNKGLLTELYHVRKNFTSIDDIYNYTRYFEEKYGTNKAKLIFEHYIFRFCEK